jgi:hypothetical protein
VRAGFCCLFDELFQTNFARIGQLTNLYRAASGKENSRAAFSNSISRAKIFPEDSGETRKC